MTTEVPLTCAGCSKELRRSARSLPQGKAMCMPCRKVAGDPNRHKPEQVAAKAPADQGCGAVEQAVRDDVEQMGDLVGVEPSLSEMAFTLAREIDAGGGEDSKQLASLNRELRQTLAQLLEGRAADDDDDLGDLASPD